MIKPSIIVGTDSSSIANLIFETKDMEAIEGVGCSGYRVKLNKEEVNYLLKALKQTLPAMTKS